MKNITVQRKFLSKIGSFEPFRLLFDMLPNVGFYIKDLSGRIMVINRCNCKNCNIPNEMAAIGKTSYDLFKPFFAKEYFDTDETVIKTGRPLLNKVLPTINCLAKPAVTNKVPVYDRHNKIIGVAMAYYYVEANSKTPSLNKRLSDLVDYIHTYYAEHVKSDQLAKIAHVSQTHLKRIFNQVFGMPPIEYLILTRINAACDLLETTDCTVGDIAQAVGFYDHSHFIRHFKRLRGCTPNQYRKYYAAQEKPAGRKAAGDGGGRRVRFGLALGRKKSKLGAQKRKRVE